MKIAKPKNGFTQTEAFNDCVEDIAHAIETYFDIEIEDVSRINDLVEQEIVEGYNHQAQYNRLENINGAPPSPHACLKILKPSQLVMRKISSRPSAFPRTSRWTPARRTTPLSNPLTQPVSNSSGDTFTTSGLMLAGVWDRSRSGILTPLSKCGARLSISGFTTSATKPQQPIFLTLTTTTRTLSPPRREIRPPSSAMGSPLTTHGSSSRPPPETSDDLASACAHTSNRMSNVHVGVAPLFSSKTPDVERT